MQKLRSLLPGGQNSASNAAQRHSVTLEPEIGFQISIEASQISTSNNNNINNNIDGSTVNYSKHVTVPELNVHLIAARHLPTLFGFKIVQGYLIKVKLFPGSKRLDSSIQTNSWPKFNENFRFPLAPDKKPSIKHSSARRSSKAASELIPEELFAGQFVVFTVYALLELPPASFNRLNKTYRSLRDKSSNFVQKVVEGSTGKSKDDKENTNTSTVSYNNCQNGSNADDKKVKRKPSDANPRDPMPPLTLSESRRNIGSVTCYLEPKIFKRNSRNNCYITEELWLPIKDITTTIPKGPNSNSLANSAKGVVEIVLEVRDLSENATSSINNDNSITKASNVPTEAAMTTTTPSLPPSTTSSTNGLSKNPQSWKRKMGMSNNAIKSQDHILVLRVTTARMRCSNKAKDELESTAGSVYAKTSVFEHNIYVDAWKSTTFYPSLSTKFDIADASGNAATICIPLKSLDCLENILIRTTLATKTKMGKKLVLGTVLVGASAAVTASGKEHMQLLRETPVNERVPMWHSYQ